MFKDILQEKGEGILVDLKLSWAVRGRSRGRGGFIILNNKTVRASMSIFSFHFVRVQRKSLSIYGHFASDPGGNRGQGRLKVGMTSFPYMN
jgi:hypothetical protein